MEIAFKIIKSETANLIGIWASIISPIITIITLILLKNIKEKFKFRQNIDDNISKINETASRISSLLREHNKNVDEIIEELEHVKIKLRSIKKQSSKETQKKIKTTMKKIDRYNRGEKYFFFKREREESEARTIKTGLTTVVKELTEEKENIILGK